MKRILLTVILWVGFVVSASAALDAKDYFQYKYELERSYQQKIEAVIQAVSGIETSTVQVTVDIDYGVDGINTADNQSTQARDHAFAMTLPGKSSVLLPIGRLKRIYLSIVLPRTSHEKIDPVVLTNAVSGVIGLDESRGDRLSLNWDAADSTIGSEQIRLLLNHIYNNLLLSGLILCIGVLLIWALFNSSRIRQRLVSNTPSEQLDQIKSYELLSFLKDYPSHIIARVLAEEHPQVIASLMTALPDADANRILAHLPERLLNDCVKRMKSIVVINPEALAQIAAALQATLTTWQLRQRHSLKS